MCYWQALQPLVSQVQQPMNITTLLTLLAAASNEHGDHTGNGEQREEADEAACDGGVERHVLRWVGGICHDELWKRLMMMVMNFSCAMSKVLYFRVNSKITRLEVRG